MKALLSGSGGREHVLARVITASKQPSELVIAPGDPGTAALGCNVALNPSGPETVLALNQEVVADLVVIGPEAPLVARVAGTLCAAGFAMFSPPRVTTQLEGSKAFAKEVMTAAGVPTAVGVARSMLAETRVALQRFGAPYVVKQNGLAAGEGMVVTRNSATALQYAAACIDAISLGASRESGVTPTPEVAPHETGSTADTASAASPAAVIEEYLDGPEASVLCLYDGENVVALPPAQDHKRARDGGEGPNTGEMGAYSPLPQAPPDLGQRTVGGIARPVLIEMARCGTPFVGLLYIGLALTSRGLRVVEFNVYFGDPETQSASERIESGLLAYLWVAATGLLGAMPELQISAEVVINVVLAAPDCPGTPQVGRVTTGLNTGCGMPGMYVIRVGARLAPREPGASGANGVNGTDGANEVSGVVASAAGQVEPSKASSTNQTVARKPAAAVSDADRRSLTSGDALVSSGGRVLSVIARGSNLETARERVYTLMAKIHLGGEYFRHDTAALQGRGYISVFRIS